MNSKTGSLQISNLQPTEAKISFLTREAKMSVSFPFGTESSVISYESAKRNKAPPGVNIYLQGHEKPLGPVTRRICIDKFPWASCEGRSAEPTRTLGGFPACCFVVTVIGKEVCPPMLAASLGTLLRRPGPLGSAGEAGSTGSGTPAQEGGLLSISGSSLCPSWQHQSLWLLGGSVLTRSA